MNIIDIAINSNRPFSLELCFVNY